ADKVALNDVVTCGVRAADADARAGPTGDDVARARRRAADGVAAGVLHPDTCAEAGDGGCARSIQADVVTFDEIIVCADVAEDAGAVVTGDDVALAGRCAADAVTARALEVDAIKCVAEIGCAGYVRAEIVADDDVVGGCADDEDADAAVAGDDVAGGSCRPADGVVVRVADGDAVDRVGQGGRAGGVCADEATGDDIPVRRINVDAVALEAVDGERTDGRATG